MREVDTREISGAAVNVIAQGTQLQGNMVTVSDCRIDGILRGNIESKAKSSSAEAARWKATSNASTSRLKAP